MTTQLKSCIAFASLLLIASAACKKNSTQPCPAVAIAPSENSGTYDSGVLISCEGIKGEASGSVSFYNRVNKIVHNNLFQVVNGSPLGFIVKSLTAFNGKNYIVVSDAAKVEVVNVTDFKSTATINGFYYPRYLIPIDNNKAYVSDWGDMGHPAAVKIVNLQNNTITGSIPVGFGPENMVKINDLVYLSCNGGKKNDSSLYIINSLTDANIQPLIVGPNPGSMQVDANGKLWVLCAGFWNAHYSALVKNGRLVKIDPKTNTIEQSFQFTDSTSSPISLSINAAKTKLLFNFNGAVYSQNVNDNYLNNKLFINKNFTGLGIDPVNDNIYGCFPGMNSGAVIRYANTGVRLDSFPVGVTPGNFTFR